MVPDRNTLLKLAQMYRTPLYVYDGEQIVRSIQTLQKAFNLDGLVIQFATKALSNRNIMRLVYSNGCGLDTVSLEEMQLALSAGIPADRINFTPSGADYSEYQFALQNGIRTHVDNLGILQKIAGDFPESDVVLRFNPDIRAGGHAYLEVGSGDSKFGFYPEELPAIEKILNRSRIRVTGIHVHVGSDIGLDNYFLHAFEYMESVAQNFLHDLELLDFGGGFKVSYKDSENSADMHWLASQITNHHRTFCEEVGKSLKLVIEPGKYLVSRSGYFLASVTAIKKTEYKQIVYLNTGFNHFLRPMYYGAYHEILNLSNPDGPRHPYKIAGYLCETDTFALNREMPGIRVGDILCFKNAGAYCFSMASNYNSRVRPAEVLLFNGHAHLIRRQETLEDIMRSEVLLDGVF